MKPFNLEKALVGDPVITRDGRKVTDLHYFSGHFATAYPLFALVGKNVLSYTTAGSYHEICLESRDDLFMASTEKTVWINYYWNRGKIMIFQHDTEEIATIARESETLKYIRTEQFTFEM